VGYGCYGCWGYHYAGSVPAYMEPAGPVYMEPAGPGYVVPPTGGTPVVPPKEEKKKETTSTQSARLIVEVPADAKFYVDDQLMKTMSERRAFVTPKLEAGQIYYYMLRAEVIRDGKVQKETKRVLVRAGEVVRANFSDLQPAVVAAVKR
jgi:uncharacterized protein (TIGR03000 family)